MEIPGDNLCLTINDYIDLSDGLRLPYNAIPLTEKYAQRRKNHAENATEIRQEIPDEIVEESSNEIVHVESQNRIIYEDELVTHSSSGFRALQPLPPGKKYHVFFSHSSEDRECVLRMVTKLESAEYGFKCCFADRDFDLGAPVFENIAKCINLSKKTVIVMSPEFLESSWCSYETRITMEMDLDTRQRLLVPVMLRNCKVPDIIGRLSYIEVYNEHFWERFIQALKDESNGSIINEAVGSAGIMGGTPFQFNPNFFNTEEICEVTVYVGCGCCSESPLEFMPNELLRHGLQLTAEDYKAIVNLISTICYVRCHGCYNKAPFWMLFLSVQGFFIFMTVMLFVTHTNASDAFPVISFMLIIDLLIVLPRLLMIKKAITSLSEALSAANKIALKSNMLVSVKEYGCHYCACNRMTIIFMYYEWRPCQSHLKTLLLQMTTPSVDEEQVESQDGDRTGLTTSETESLNMSQLETRAEDLLHYHATEYGQLVISRRTKNPDGQRHTRQKECLCQFAESILLSKKSSCLGCFYGGQIRHPWRRFIEF